MATGKKKSLGFGVDALFSNTDIEEVKREVSASVTEIKISDIEPGDGQPRKVFDKEKIEELAESIKKYGVIQPIIVHKKGNIYKIIAGERRWRAARLAGLKTVPVIEKEATDRQSMEMALIENIQREDLNPIEEAEAYNRLATEYDLTQEKLAEVVDKSRSAVANVLRMLSLPDEIKKMVAGSELSEGHARTLLSLDDKNKQLEVAKAIISGNLNVRQAEALVKKLKNAALTEELPENTENIAVIDQYRNAIEDMQNRLKTKLGTNVVLKDKKGKGKITIEFYSADERERIIDLLLKN